MAWSREYHVTYDRDSGTWSVMSPDEHTPRDTGIAREIDARVLALGLAEDTRSSVFFHDEDGNVVGSTVF